MAQYVKTTKDEIQTQTDSLEGVTVDKINLPDTTLCIGSIVSPEVAELQSKVSSLQQMVMMLMGCSYSTPDGSDESIPYCPTEINNITIEVLSADIDDIDIPFNVIFEATDYILNEGSKPQTFTKHYRMIIDMINDVPLQSISWQFDFGFQIGDGEENWFGFTDVDDDQTLFNEDENSYTLESANTNGAGAFESDLMSLHAYRAFLTTDDGIEFLVTIPKIIL